ncbi:MAG: MBL fold metallo-hydrolase [Candidatus Pelagadaptatus aseana]|uniref:MBL fold metallo-hydrolase n=1 Tax=Candidatus Pelagadaptatus aseana TaxID=3120508 RepID=UPI0039B13A76
MKFITVSALCLSVLLIVACAYQPREQWVSDQYRDGVFHNLEPYEQDFGVTKTLTIIQRFFFTEHADTEPFGLIPVDEINVDAFMAGDEDRLVRLGHSTVLMKLNNQYWLTDPIFSQRASPLQWVGPERFHQPPIRLEELPDLTGVLISHDHYDHLDEGTIRRLHPKVSHFYVPLGVAKYLRQWGVPDDKISEFDWWQQATVGDTAIVSTPSNHFSGRSLFNRNGTLWTSWVIDSGKRKIYFSGDSGYFAGFKEIGEKFGPFDVTIMENGAYNPDWRGSHLFPDETIAAHRDLNGRALLPVHNSTFKLAFHPWYDPLQATSKMADQTGVDLKTPKIGEVWTLADQTNFSRWWQVLMPGEKSGTDNN